jgi:hypothetical protein
MNYKNYFKQRLIEQLISEAEYQGMEDGVPVFTPSTPPKPKPYFPGGGPVTIRPTTPPSSKPAEMPSSSEEYQAPIRDRRQRNRTPSSYQD